MKTYFKATRPDGTDFRTGTVDYAAALTTGTIKRKPAVDSYSCCSGTVYHASDTPSETLIGGSWPCRLFEVTGRPVAQEGHKYGFRSLRVVREIPAWQALGPNGADVAALIDRASRLTAGEASRLDAARYAALDAAWVAARYAALDAARYAARDAALVALQGAVQDAAWVAALDAARYAVTALVARDLITEEHFNTLHGPWASVIEP